jgi:hypothetical protein
MSLRLLRTLRKHLLKRWPRTALSRLRSLLRRKLSRSLPMARPLLRTVSVRDVPRVSTAAEEVVAVANTSTSVVECKATPDSIDIHAGLMTERQMEMAMGSNGKTAVREGTVSRELTEAEATTGMTTASTVVVAAAAEATTRTGPEERTASRVRMVPNRLTVRRGESTEEEEMATVVAEDVAEATGQATPSTETRTPTMTSRSSKDVAERLAEAVVMVNTVAVEMANTEAVEMVSTEAEVVESSVVEACAAAGEVIVEAMRVAVDTVDVAATTDSRTKMDTSTSRLNTTKALRRRRLAPEETFKVKKTLSPRPLISQLQGS